ncbi:MAG TPA: rhamnulokinase family protein [Bacteroidota bacterium]|nr:rhamnulokinase family protein [Bacteroidota bacterium]
MNEDRRFIGFDIGAESGRCVVATLAGGRLSLEEVHRFATHSVVSGESLHWDILAIASEIIEGLTRAAKAFGPTCTGIGIDTWGVDYVLVDPAGRVLGYPYHYRDGRTDGIMAEAFAIVPKEELYRGTGIQFLQFNTVFQLLAEHRQGLDLLSVAGSMLMVPDYLNFVLSGRRAAEYSIASTTGLIDPRTRNWSWKLIDAFGFPRRIFPSIIEPGTSLGTILPAVAAKCGIHPGTPVIATAGHDTASAVASVPAGGGSDWAYLSSGTWSLMGIELSEPRLTDDALQYNFTNEGGIGRTICFLKNILGLWPIQECRRHWQAQGEEMSYARIASLAAAEGPARAWVDLDDPRFLKPGEMPAKIASFLGETGQSASDRPGFIIRVILESLAYSYRRTIRQLEHATGRSIRTLHAVGGGIQNELLMQCTADATGLPVVAGPVEGTIVGNIGVLAMGTGAVSTHEEWRTIVARSFGLKTYSPVGTEYYDKHEDRYRRVNTNRL